MVWKNPKWTDEKKKWLMGIIEGMVSNPQAANILTIYGRFDLEIALIVSPEDEVIFSDEILEALTKIVGKATDTFRPVIYLDGKPNAAAQEAIDYVYNDL